MERQFEENAEVVRRVIRLFEDDVKNAQDSVNKIVIDWRFSPAGKEQRIKELYEALNEIAENRTELIKEAVQRFCDTYRVKLPVDDKDHSMDIANALKVIDMLGFNLTVETLKTILEPIRNSYKHMKMILDVLDAKSHGFASAAGIAYDPKIFETIHEYLGVNSGVLDYLDAFKNIEEIGVADIYKLKFSAMKYTNGTTITMQPEIPYAVLALPGEILRVGTMYMSLEDEFSSLFKAHVPTDSELIESTIKRQ